MLFSLSLAQIAYAVAATASLPPYTVFQVRSTASVQAAGRSVSGYRDGDLGPAAPFTRLLVGLGTSDEGAPGERPYRTNQRRRRLLERLQLNAEQYHASP